MGCVLGKEIVRRKKEEEEEEEEEEEATPSSGGAALVCRMEQLLLVLNHTYLSSEASKESITQCKTFTFWQVHQATRNFGLKHVLGERDLGGKVYRGYLDEQDVAIKFLDILDGERSTRHFVNEVSALCRARHNNIIRLIGFCCQGDQRILVYEPLPLKSLEQRLFDIPADAEPLDWRTRKRILAGIASALEYLHEEMDPPVQLGGLTSANILLDKESTPKLAYFGLATAASPSGMQADMYSFGMVFVEMLTGSRANDLTSNFQPDYDIANWARRLIRESLVDPKLQDYSEPQLQVMLDFAAACLVREPTKRPTASTISCTMNLMKLVDASGREN